MKKFTFYKLPAVLIISFLLVSFLPATVQGQTKTFTGTGNFSTAARWSGGTLPVAGNNLVIDGVCTVDNNAGTDNIAYGTLTIGTATGRTLSWAAGGTNRLNVSNVSAGAGASTLNMTNGGTLIIRGTWTSTNLTFTSGAGTIETRSTITLPTAYATYNNLTVNGAGITVTLGVATAVTGNLAITAGTLNANNFNTTVTGNWINNGIFTPGTSTVTFTGATSTTLSGSSTTDFNQITINKGTNYNSILDVQSMITMLAGGLTLTNGTFKLSSASTIIPFAADIVAPPYLIPSTAGFWCNGGTINGPISDASWAVAGLLRISAGTINQGFVNNVLNPMAGANIVVEGGNLNVGDRISQVGSVWTFTMTGGTVTVPTDANVTAGRSAFNMEAAASSFSMSGGTIIIRRPSGSAGQNLGYYNVATGGTGFTGGTLQIGDASTPAGSTIKITSTIPVYNLVVGSANVTALLATSPLTVANDVTISSGTLAGSNLNLSVGGDWFNNVSTAAFSAGTGTVLFNGAAPQSIAGSFVTTFNNLTASGSSTVTSAINTNVTGNLSVSSGTLDIGGFTANRATAGGILTVSNGATLKIGSTNTVPSNYSTHSIGATSTIEYNGTAQSVAVLNSADYGHLTISGSGTKTLAANEGAAGNITISAGTFTANNFNITVGGNWINNVSTAAFTAGSGTVTFNGTAPQSITGSFATTFNNLTVSASSTVTAAINASVVANLSVSSGTLDIGGYTVNRATAGGTLTVSNGATLKIGSTNTVPSNYSTHSIGATSTIEYNGTAQSVLVLNSAQNYGHLTVSGSGSKTLAGTVTVAGTLTFAGATITTGANTIYINATGTVSRTGGHVIGNLRKYIATGATSKTFEIGDATNYTPAAVAFANVTAAGDLTGTVTAGDHANIGSCMIIPGRTANRNWMLTNTGIVFTTYSATFTFVAGDLDPGAAPSNFIIAKYSAGWTYPPVGARTSTTTEVTGVTAFSDFQAGETIPLPVTYTSIKAIPNNKTISIDWQVGEESGIQKYEIERAADGINFSKAGEVAARGNNSSESYLWLDVQPMTGNNYYRVRALQADGNFFLSRIVVVKMNGDKAVMNVFPNPAKKQQINIGIDEMAKGTYTLLIHNPQGLQMIQRMIDHPGGSFNQTIYLNKTLPAGMFYLQIANEKEKYGQTIFIE